jgi:Glycosyl transferase family 2
LVDLLLDSLCQEKELKNDMMEKESPLVSVIIPVYNAHNSIAKTLQSVINQTYTNLEIVVVNDGSTDESLDIIKTYAVEDPRIVVFDKQNEGLVQARKSGIDIATGKYIQYLDSDDIMHEDAITRLVNKAEETQADMVVAPFYVLL